MIGELHTSQFLTDFPSAVALSRFALYDHLPTHPRDVGGLPILDHTQPFHKTPGQGVGGMQEDEPLHRPSRSDPNGFPHRYNFQFPSISGMMLTEAPVRAYGVPPEDPALLRAAI
jgi:hypothetical protein